MSKGKTHCIIGAAAGLLWGATLATTHVDLNFRLFLVVWLATGVVSLAGLAWVGYMKMEARQQRRDEATVALVKGAVGSIEVATREHATRMEAATARHGDHICSTALRADRWFHNGMAAVKIARDDAPLDVARASGDDGGSLRVINGRG